MSARLQTLGTCLHLLRRSSSGFATAAALMATWLALKSVDAQNSSGVWNIVVWTALAIVCSTLGQGEPQTAAMASGPGSCSQKFAGIGPVMLVRIALAAGLGFGAVLTLAATGYLAFLAALGPARAWL